MEKVAFRLVAAVKVYDFITKLPLSDAKIVTAEGLKRINKANGVIVLVDDKKPSGNADEDILVYSPKYQSEHIHVLNSECGLLHKAWLLPGPHKEIPRNTIVVKGKTSPKIRVSLIFGSIDTGLRMLGLTEKGELRIAKIGCREPEGCFFLVDDGSNKIPVYITDLTREEDEGSLYRYKAERDLSCIDAASACFRPMVQAEADEDGSYYLPIWLKLPEGGSDAVLMSEAEGDQTEKIVHLEQGSRVEENI